MPANSTALAPQKATRNNSGALVRIPREFPDTVSWWAEQYFRLEVTTSSSSQKVQCRDIQLFISYMFDEEERDDRVAWSPRLSKAFQVRSRKEVVDGHRRCADRTVNRVLTHLKTFAKWIHKLRPFPLGNPMEKIRLLPLGTALEVERALTVSERRKILDAADLLVEIGGRSRDRIRAYNTCAGYRYVRGRQAQAAANWGLPEGSPEGPYEDLDAFLLQEVKECTLSGHYGQDFLHAVLETIGR